MKRKHLLWLIPVAIVAIIVVILVYNLSGHQDDGKSPKALLPADEKVSDKLEGYRAEWYSEITSIMVDNNSPIGTGAVQEYIVANSLALRGIEYINIKMYADQTGEMTHKFYNSEWKSDGEMIFNGSVLLTPEQAMQAVQVFEDNHFWEIPPKHPDEHSGLDGNTIFIEGISENNYNLISMWHPDDQYEIKKIYDEVMRLAGLWGLDRQ